MKVSKKAYLHVFTIIVLALGLLRLTTDIDEPKTPEQIAMEDSLAIANEEAEEQEEESVPVSKETLENPDNLFPQYNEGTQNSGHVKGHNHREVCIAR